VCDAALVTAAKQASELQATARMALATADGVVVAAADNAASALLSDAHEFVTTRHRTRTQRWEVGLSQSLYFQSITTTFTFTSLHVRTQRWQVGSFMQTLALSLRTLLRPYLTFSSLPLPCLQCRLDAHWQCVRRGYEGVIDDGATRESEMQTLLHRATAAAVARNNNNDAAALKAAAATAAAAQALENVVDANDAAAAAAKKTAAAAVAAAGEQRRCADAAAADAFAMLARALACVGDADLLSSTALRDVWRRVVAGR
jgi:hypothetical protein